MPDEPNDIKTDDDLRDTMAALLADVPAPVQAFITNGKLEEVALGISGKYKMRADQAGKFEHALLLMLLGVYEPGQFIEKLQNAELPNPVISGTVADLEDQVFIPLRKAETAQAVPVAAPRAPAVPVPAPFGMSTAAPVPASAPVFNTPPVPMTPAAPPIPDPFAAFTQPVPTVPSPVPNVAPAEPLMRTMAHDVEAMQSGVAPVPAPYVPAQTPAPLPPPPAAPAPAPQAPWIPPAPSIPPSQIPAAPEIPRTPQRTPDPDIHEVTSTLQKYGIDPYREPPE